MRLLVAAGSVDTVGEYVYPAARPGHGRPPDLAAREPALAGVVVPLRQHFGTMGVAPAEPLRVSSVPPGDHDGNVDNWRVGADGRMYYPVQVPGALPSVGDPHVSQGAARSAAPRWNRP